MIRRRVLSLMFLGAFLWVGRPLAAQDETPTRVTSQNRSGDLPFSPRVGTAIEGVDTATGALRVTIPVVLIPGRGLNSELYLRFESNIYVRVTRTDGFGNPYYI